MQRKSSLVKGLVAVVLAGAMQSCTRDFQDTFRSRSDVHPDSVVRRETVEQRILERASSAQVIMLGERHLNSAGNPFTKNSDYVSFLLPYLSDKGFSNFCIENDSNSQSIYDEFASGKISKDAAIRRSIEMLECVKSFEDSVVKFEDYAEASVRKRFNNDTMKIEEYRRNFGANLISFLGRCMEEARVAHANGMKVVLYDDESYLNSPDSDRLYALRDREGFDKLKSLLKKGDRLVVHCGFAHMETHDPGKPENRSLADYIEGMIPKERLLRVGLQQENIAGSSNDENPWIASCSDLQAVVEERLRELEKYKK